MAEPALVLRDIRKAYYGNPVLKGVSLEVQPGEIHGLVGENGAGKSTLMNILFGMPVIQETGGYEGEILLGGEKVDPRSPMEAMSHGVGMVHQEFMLLPGFTVTENIKLNREISHPNPVSRVLSPLTGGRSRALETLDAKAMARDARASLDRIGMSLDEGVPVGGLPVGHMQFVEIAREVDKANARVIVFDEPTAVLTEGEAAELLATMKALAKQGIAILFITHRLDEIMEVADNITVLRDGTRVVTISRAEATVATIAEQMIGHQMVTRDLPPRLVESKLDETVMEITDLKVAMPGERVRGVNLTVRRGEILGLGGLAGQGKVGVANGIMGLYPATGRVTLDGKEIPLGSPRLALENGLAFVSEDRRGVGLLLDESIADNITSTAVQVQRRFLRGSGALALYNKAEATEHAKSCIGEFDIRCQGPHQPVRRLSGGNQQKVCLSRAFTLKPQVLFVSEPTRGIDVGAKDLVLHLLIKMNRELGTTIVLTSSELAELRRVCDRIAIIDKGEVAGILEPTAPDVEYGLLMGGKKSKGGAA